MGRIAGALLRILGVNIPSSVTIGPGLRLPHGAVGLVVHERTVLGNDVKLYQGVTLGRADTFRPDQEPWGHIVIGDNALVGAGAVVLFHSGTVLTIGAGAVIGANSVVTKNVPAGETWAGQPARKL